MESQLLKRIQTELEAKPHLWGQSLASDNHSGVHPRLLNAIQIVNQGATHAYGADPMTELAQSVFRTHFGDQTEVSFCFNGTAANVLSLRPFVDSYQSVICSDISHLNVDECGAPEFHLRAKIIAVQSDKNGKLSVDAIKPHFIRKGDQHFSQVRAVSITQPTEYGTVYSIDEINQLAAFVHSHGAILHIDGTRLPNAVWRLGTTFRAMTENVDVVSFGGTKNGFLFGEAVLFLGNSFAKGSTARQAFPYYRKQLMQLASKTRFIAAQFIEYLDSNLWIEIASQSCQTADRLRAGLQALPNVEIFFPTESNAVFAIFPESWIKPLRQASFFYVWDETTKLCRLMTSHATTHQEVDDFLNVARQLSDQTQPSQALEAKRS